jgi:hypothetical protein
MRYAKLTTDKSGGFMNTASVTLVLQKLENVMTMARAISLDAQACGDSDARLTELLTTLNAVEHEMQAMQQLLGKTNGTLSDLQLPCKLSHQSESPYYWEDD